MHRHLHRALTHLELLAESGVGRRRSFPAQCSLQMFKQTGFSLIGKLGLQSRKNRIEDRECPASVELPVRGGSIGRLAVIPCFRSLRFQRDKPHTPTTFLCLRLVPFEHNGL